MSASLYERLGGPEGVVAIAQDLVDLHLGNPLINSRFKDSNAADLKALAGDFLGAGTGGSEAYAGRDMLATHRGMNISEEEFIAVLDDALKALDNNGIGQREKEEVLFILYSMKGEVVRG